MKNAKGRLSEIAEWISTKWNGVESSKVDRAKPACPFKVGDVVKMIGCNGRDFFCRVLDVEYLPPPRDDKWQLITEGVWKETLQSMGEDSIGDLYEEDRPILVSRDGRRVNDSSP